MFLYRSITFCDVCTGRPPTVEPPHFPGIDRHEHRYPRPALRSRRRPRSTFRVKVDQNWSRGERRKRLHRVLHACAKRKSPEPVGAFLHSGGGGRNRTGVHGFAGRCITTLLPRLGAQHRIVAIRGKPRIGRADKEKGKQGFPSGLERETRLALGA